MRARPDRVAGGVICVAAPAGGSCPSAGIIAGRVTTGCRRRGVQAGCVLVVTGTAVPGVLGPAWRRVIFRTSRPTASPANAAIGLVAAVRRSARMTGWPGSGWMWPMFPAMLTVRPVSAVAQGQTRCRGGQPSR